MAGVLDQVLNIVLRVKAEGEDALNRINKSTEVMRKNMRKNVGPVQALALAMRKLTMQFLGVMFFGMMMQRMFLGLLQPAMQAFGVFDLWQVMLTTLFLPIMEQLMPLFLDFFDFIVNLPDEVKLLIGALAVLGVIFGTILMVVGQLALGVFALISVWPLLGAAVEGVILFIGSLFSVLGASILLILAGIIIAWKEDFGDMKDWVQVLINGITDIFQGLVDIIKGIFEVITSAIEGDFDGVVEGVKLIWEGFVTFLKGLGETIISAFAIVGLGVFRIFFGLWETLKQGFFALFAWLDEVTGGYISTAKDNLVKLLNLFAQGLMLMGPQMWGKAADVLSISAKINKLKFDRTLTPEEYIQSDQFVGPKQPTSNGGTTVINNTTNNNVQVSDSAEFQRMLDENSKKVVDELQNMTLFTPSKS